MASATICGRIATSEVLREAQLVLTYLAFRNEPDLSSLVEMFPAIRWVVPRVDGDRLELHLLEPGRLVRHPFGMMEPSPDSPTVEPSALDIVLVPGVAFDRTGVRLGFGGGFYDRLLPRTSASRVGVALDCCVTDALPHEQHDQTMDWVVTPDQWFRGQLREH